MGYVFISYSHHDSTYTEDLRVQLERAGVETWVDRGDIPPGARYRRVISDAIDDCDALVVVMSPSARDSNWVEDELDWARQQKKPILPLRPDPATSRVALGFSTNQIGGRFAR